MLLGTYVYSNLNKAHLEKAVKQIIPNVEISTEVQVSIDSIYIGSVDRQDVINVVDSIAQSTYTPDDVDLIPIYDAIEGILYIWNEEINKEFLVSALETKIENTVIYDGIDYNQPVAVIDENKEAIKEAFLTQIKEIVAAEDLSNSSQENVEKAINAVNITTALAFDSDDVIIEMASDLQVQINTQNTLLAIEEIVKKDYGVIDANDGSMLYREYLEEAANEVGLHTLSEAEIRETLEVFFNKIASFIENPNIDEAYLRVASKLEHLNLGPAVIGNDYIIDLTPVSYNTGQTNIDTTEVFTTIVERDKQNYITKVDDQSISISVKDVLQKVTAEDVTIKAQVKHPRFKVSVFGGSKINFDEEDSWKVLTNDGENYRWEYVENFFKQGVGLLKSVKKLSDLDALPERYLSNGMIVYVESTGVYYSLVDRESRTWDIFQKIELDITKPKNREVVFKNIKLGHGDTGSDLKLSWLNTYVVDTEDESRNLEDYIDYSQPNLISIKNVGYKPATINIDEGSLIINPNSVYETPFDRTMIIKLNGIFNVVGAYVEFLVYAEEMCTQKPTEDLPVSLVNPYF